MIKQRTGCDVDGCERKHMAHGYCAMHGYHWKRYDDPLFYAPSPTHCPRGHEFTEDNTKITIEKSGYTHRHCRTCQKVRSSERRAICNGSLDDIDYLELMKRDHWVCQLCGTKIPPKARRPHPLSGSIDHAIPISKGGQHVWSNVQAAHLECNFRKHTRDHPTKLPAGVEQSQLVLPLR